MPALRITRAEILGLLDQAITQSWSEAAVKRLQCFLQPSWRRFKFYLVLIGILFHLALLFFVLRPNSAEASTWNLASTPNIRRSQGGSANISQKDRLELGSARKVGALASAQRLARPAKSGNVFELATREGFERGMPTASRSPEAG